MNKRQQLYYLLNAFVKEEYSVQTFCDVFEGVFYPDPPRDELSPRELELFEALGEIVTRYTPFPEELEKYPGVYKNASDVKNAIYAVIDKLTAKQ